MGARTTPQCRGDLADSHQVRDPKQTTDLPEFSVADEVCTVRVPRVDTVDAATMRRPPTQKATLTSRGRRATFALESIVANTATLTGPLTFALGDRVALTLEVDGALRTLAAEIVGVTTADLLTDHVTIAFVDPLASSQLTMRREA